MGDEAAFVDYYGVLQVYPDCDAKVLEGAYRHLAKMYHPDHIETADVDKFNAVIEAYRRLRDPDARAAYDVQYSAQTGFEFPPEADGGEKAALTDADMHAKMLKFLYARRREHALDAGVGRYFVQQELNCSDEHFEFHLWYLKAKGFIQTTEQGTLEITIEGVDHVIATSRTAAKEKLLIAQSRDAPDEPRL